MSSLINCGVDDKDLDDDDALWAVIDSVATAVVAARNISHVQKHTSIRSPPPPPISHSNKLPQNPRIFQNDKEVSNYPPQKTSPNSSSPIGDAAILTHSLAAPFPTVSLFKEYQNAAMAILERSDYTMISGSPFIKKTGWRKISFYFNLSYEIKDKTIEFDENRNVLRAEFIVRAHMQGARFSDGWGSCERREKKFLKPNHDIPSTAETRAKNRACQDLLGIGEY